MLDMGYWSEFVGGDLIYFIFKMTGHKVKEFPYSEDNRMQIAQLCTQLNKVPIEKTSNLPDHLSDNSFYAEMIENLKV